MILRDGEPGAANRGTGGNVRLRKPARIILAGVVLGPAIQGLLFFAAAGRFDLPRAWLFVALTFVWMAANTGLLAVTNPDLLNQRGMWKEKRDAKPWDRKLLVLFGLAGFYLPPAVMGLDVGRYGWSNLGLWATVLGIAAATFGWVVITWAMVVNPHFEVTVRIQTDRDHKVISRGPYAIVRHPGYLGGSLWALGSPLVVGSLYGLIPAAMTILILLFRTHREDRTLQAELPGYADYAKRVRYRLVPGVW